MKKARAVAAWGISVVVGAGMLWACSSSTTEPGASGNENGNQDATTGSDSSSTYSTGDGSTTPTPDSGVTKKTDAGTDGGGTGACGASATQGACYQCCDTASDGGVQEFFNLQLSCLCSARHCDTNATCKETLCKNPDVDDAGAKCNACQDKEFADDAGDAGCVDPVNDECASNPSCLAGISCVVDSNCDSLPQ
jgi:hypothetical protein